MTTIASPATAATDPDRLTSLTVAAAAAAIRAGDVSPLELTHAYLARIDAVDLGIGAYLEVSRARALADAARAGDELARRQDRGPLHGVPVALKDLIDTAGITTAAGCGAYRHRVPAADATVAARLREAGAVLLGKTNTHELAFGVTTTNPHFGTTRNPHDPSRIPGGSSGGNGAALAAGLAAAAVGTDTGGSVRIPAAFCGCVGLKPTFGRVPTTGVATHVADRRPRRPDDPHRRGRCCSPSSPGTTRPTRPACPSRCRTMPPPCGRTSPGCGSASRGRLCGDCSTTTSGRRAIRPSPS